MLFLGKSKNLSNFLKCLLFKNYTQKFCYFCFFKNSNQKLLEFCEKTMKKQKYSKSCCFFRQNTKNNRKKWKFQKFSRKFWNFGFSKNRAKVLPIRQKFWVRGKVLIRAKIQKLLVLGIFAFSSSRAQHFYRMAALSCACQQNRRQTLEKPRFH